MIKAWADHAEAGVLERHGKIGSAFTYFPNARESDAVSVTMHPQAASWIEPQGLAPIFEMNLPEGALREKIRLAFAKATGRFDDFDMLAVVGRSQVGRLRYTGTDDTLNEGVPFQSIDEVLKAQRDGDLFDYLITKFAAYSGVSGVQPKVLVSDPGSAVAFQKLENARISQSFRGATHIVKLWDANEFPQLAANEYFCLKVAERCGLEVPRFQLADDGTALVIDRFDLKADGTYLGVEDFCVLNAFPTAQKYRGSYESQVFKRLQQFTAPEDYAADREKLFTLMALNCALQNGDAHLKNFAIVYENAAQATRLAPVYDIVTTTVYNPRDAMALTLNGSQKWPDAKVLQTFAAPRLQATPRKIQDILSRIADAVSDTRPELERYAKDHAAFAEVGARMLKAWDEGVKHALC